jgi:hypothetical protein
MILKDEDRRKVEEYREGRKKMQKYLIKIA